MKNLYLVRHAEAVRQHASQRDYDRPLHESGKEDARHMVQQLSRCPNPMGLVSSPAIRAKETATIFATALAFPISNMKVDERIYEAEVEDLLSVIGGVDNNVSCLMLVGHNPGLSQLVNDLVHSDIGNMPTCSLAVLHLSSDSWSDIGIAKAELQDFNYPGKAGG